MSSMNRKKSLPPITNRRVAARVRRVVELYEECGWRDDPRIDRLYREYAANGWLADWARANEEVRRATVKVKESVVFTLKRQPLLGVPPRKVGR